ncbi:MAG: hypothetical protein Tsb0018_05930 [Opitutales bacterium]
MAFSFPKKITIFVRVAEESDDQVRLFFSTLQTQNCPSELEWLVVYQGVDPAKMNLLKKYEFAVLSHIEADDFSLGALLNWVMASSSCDWVLALTPAHVPKCSDWLTALLRYASNVKRFGVAFLSENQNAWPQGRWFEDVIRLHPLGLYECNLDACLMHKHAWKGCSFRQDLECAEGYVWSVHICQKGYSVDSVGRALRLLPVEMPSQITLKDRFWNARAEACAVGYALSDFILCPSLWRLVVLGLLKDIVIGGKLLLRKLRGIAYLKLLCASIAVRLGAYAGVMDGLREASLKTNKRAKHRH